MESHKADVSRYWSGRAHAYDEAQQKGERSQIEKELWKKAFSFLSHDDGTLVHRASNAKPALHTTDAKQAVGGNGTATGHNGDGTPAIRKNHGTTALHCTDATPDLRGSDDGKQALRVLDVGCGSGYLSRIVAGFGHNVVGLDSSPGMLREAESHHVRGLQTVLGDATCPPESLGKFDVIVSRYVMWTLEDPYSAVCAWKKMLDPQGPGIIAIADANWFPSGEGLEVDVDSEDGENAFIDTYGHGYAEQLPLATLDSPQSYLDIFQRAGLRAHLTWLPEIDELDLICGVSRGHMPRKRFLIRASVTA
ncbi:class I SAM-dependent methyltransferase [Actinotignum urinale]|uniref:class I SAM-dependent methyltransferase n=1 Tax=Actinotignum urinale TaxID=190146 RepID=UPI002A811ECF|nr:class I SAM-dependent methyltransferase [Actinotignum urinale]MDY5129662.1 class I SAM-dependent methyltransferase [Actinotignum urinale]